MFKLSFSNNIIPFRGKWVCSENYDGSLLISNPRTGKHLTMSSHCVKYNCFRGSKSTYPINMKINKWECLTDEGNLILFNHHKGEKWNIHSLCVEEGCVCGGGSQYVENNCLHGEERLSNLSPYPN